MKPKKISVLIVDDSPVSQELMKHVLSSDSQLEVIGIAKDGLEALKKLETLTPDVITMDIVMPHMNGFETTRRIMQTKPTPIVIISRIAKEEDVECSFKSIEAGALSILQKPEGVFHPQYARSAQLICETIKMISDARVVKGLPTPPSKIPLDTKKKQTYEALGIGASLGGPQALQKLLFDLPETFPVPIYVVQHIASGFMSGFAHWLDSSSRLDVKLATHGEKAVPGTVYICPENTHMEVFKGNIIHLTNAPPENGIRPSVTHLFLSMAQQFGQNAIGVLLTGMGRDGVDGLLAMKQQGGTTLAQGKENCIMFGMPAEAIKIGAAEHVVPINMMASFLKKLVDIA